MERRSFVRGNSVYSPFFVVTVTAIYLPSVRLKALFKISQYPTPKECLMCENIA